MALLAGSGRDLVRLGFDAPVRIVGRPEAGGFRIQVSPAVGFDLQLSFREERNVAQGLARDARERAEEALVREAEGSRSRMVDAGLSEVRELSQRLERARFFRLVDIFRRASARANDIAAR